VSLATDKWSVDDVTRQLGVTPRTLHYYEEVGLIPVCARTAGGHRLYDQGTIDKLTHILRLKEYLGYSLQEIRGILDAEDDIERLRMSYHSSEDQRERQIILDECAQSLDGIVRAIDDKLERLSVMRRNFQERLDRCRQLQTEFDKSAQS